MPEINLFNGGINTHKDSRKLEPNEFTQILDADITSGSVVSIPLIQPSAITSDPVGATFVDYKGKLVSGNHPYLKFERMQNKLFKSDGSIVTYTNGDVDSNDNHIWHELGLAAPEDNIEAKVLVDADNVTFTILAPKGVSSPQTYYYLLVVDDEYSFSLDYECTDSCAQIEIDTTGVPGTTIEVYRRWEGDIFFISSDSVFVDFAMPLDYFPTLAESALIYHQAVPRSLTRMTWYGDGTFRIYADYDNSWSVSLNFRTGAISDPIRTTYGYFAVTNLGKNLVSNYYSFRVTFYHVAKMFVVDITVDSYNISYINGGNLYPNFQDWNYVLDNLVCNSRGDLLDMTITHSESQVGDFSYQLTYVDAGEQESTGGPISNTVESRGANIEVTIPPLTLDGSVVNVYLYRQNAKDVMGYFRIATFTKAEGEVGIVFIDDIQVEELGPPVPSRTLSEVNSDSLFPTSVQGRLFLVTKHDDELDQDYSAYMTLIWSNLGNAIQYTSLDFLPVDHPIIGLGKCANGLILYHRESTYILQSIQTEAFNYRSVSESHGCIDHRSIQAWGGYAICAALDGISITDGSNTQLITYDKLGIMDMTEAELGDYDSNAELDNSNIISSAVVGNHYFLLFKAGSILKVDLLSNIFTYISADNVIGVGHINGRLYGSLQEELNLITYNKEGTRTYKVVTGDIADNIMCNLKEYTKVRISITGTARLNVYIDNIKILSNIEIKRASEFISIPNESNRGYTIRFEGIEYSVQGRNNG